MFENYTDRFIVAQAKQSNMFVLPCVSVLYFQALRLVLLSKYGAAKANHSKLYISAPAASIYYCSCRLGGRVHRAKDRTMRKNDEEANRAFRLSPIRIGVRPLCDKERAGRSDDAHFFVLFTNWSEANRRTTIGREYMPFFRLYRSSRNNNSTEEAMVH